MGVRAFLLTKAQIGEIENCPPRSSFQNLSSIHQLFTSLDLGQHTPSFSSTRGSKARVNLI